MKSKILNLKLVQIKILFLMIGLLLTKVLKIVKLEQKKEMTIEDLQIIRMKN